MQIITPEAWYRTRRIDDDITHIEEPYIKPFYRCNIWHVRGRERDMLVDSGMGVVSLRAQVVQLAERPLLAVASHTHFDHIGCHHEFSERAVHAEEAELMAAPGRRGIIPLRPTRSSRRRRRGFSPPATSSISATAASRCCTRRGIRRAASCCSSVTRGCCCRGIRCMTGR